ncbi:hypothetical protein Pcinc_041322 [Petrolisthes cinctipes]|uniref:Uncharacterized protein n=1 Tax=Petrolisthes cinctipes TaxID=88211 RepID=A0AAE1EIJ4_PETCI|nr:hypothetical protein Pcinc_041322 [Petrolisthes cinctipes]
MLTVTSGYSSPHLPPSLLLYSPSRLLPPSPSISTPLLSLQTLPYSVPSDPPPPLLPSPPTLLLYSPSRLLPTLSPLIPLLLFSPLPQLYSSTLPPDSSLLCPL